MFVKLELLLNWENWVMKVWSKGRQHAVEQGSLEGFTAVEEREQWKSLSYVKTQMNICFGTLFISQKWLTNNWQMKCGVEMEILLLLGLTISSNFSKIE